MDAEELQRCLTQSGISGTYSREISHPPPIEIGIGNSYPNILHPYLQYFTVFSLKNQIILQSLL